MCHAQDVINPVLRSTRRGEPSEGLSEYLISWEGELGSQHCNAAPGTLWYRRKMLVFSSRTVRRGMRVNAVQMLLLHYSVTWCNFLLVAEADSHEST